MEVIPKEDIKTFIKKLKEEFDYTFWAEFNYEGCLILEGEFQKKIDKLAGGKLK